MLRSILGSSRQLISKCAKLSRASLCSKTPDSPLATPTENSSSGSCAAPLAEENDLEPSESSPLVREAYTTDSFKKLKLDQYPFYVEREWWKKGSRMTFWATWRQRRDVTRREVVQETGADRMRLKALKWNTVLPQAIRDAASEDLHNMPKYSRPRLILNMCMFTGRQRGKIKPYRLNRHLFRKYADHSQLSGVQRAMCMESDFGISSYLGNRSEPVPAVLKMLYSDFIVSEILQDKTTARILTSRPELPSRTENRAPEDENILFPAHLSEETRNSLTELYKNGKGTVKLDTETLSKEQRKEIHQFLRARFNGNLASETQGSTICVSFGQKNFHSQRWVHPNFCHFTLAKENKDTAYAISIISRFLNVKETNSFKTCGIKDRRAVTAQRVSAYRVTKEKLMALNRTLRGISVYDCEYMDAGLKTGSHWGNRFNIVLRNFPKNKRDVLEERVQELRQHGFINYYGMQRFGSCGTNTAEVGKQILLRNWESAVKLILEDATAKEATAEWKKSGDAHKAKSLLKGAQSFASIEGQILHSLSKGSSWQEAILRLPANVCSLYVHAYQSLLWNKAVSRRIREHGETVVPGDVGPNGTALHENASQFDVYLPLPGTEVNHHYVEAWYGEMLTESGLTPSSFTSLNNRFALGDAYRAMLIRPDDIDFEFIEYEDERAQLLDGLSSNAIPPSDRQGSRLALRVAFNLQAGAYATVALRQITAFDMGKQSMKNLCGVSDEIRDPESTDAAKKSSDGAPPEKRARINNHDNEIPTSD